MSRSLGVIAVPVLLFVAVAVSPCHADSVAGSDMVLAATCTYGDGADVALSFRTTDSAAFAPVIEQGVVDPPLRQGAARQSGLWSGWVLPLMATLWLILGALAIFPCMCSSQMSAVERRTGMA
jgi:hypothetical protein